MITLLAELPLIAILRGVTPQRIEGVADVLFDAGFRAIEVPLNSPRAFMSIETLAKSYGDRCLIGAGTVLDCGDVDRLADVGGKLLVTPNTNPTVISRGVDKGLVVMPGFHSPTEAFAAIAAGTRTLKLFPAVSAGTAHLRAALAVLPSDASVYAVGGVGAGNMKDWRRAGAAGFGVGSDLFMPEFTDQEIAARARKSITAYQSAA